MCLFDTKGGKKEGKKRISKQEKFPHSRNSCPLKCSTDKLTVISPAEVSYQTKITFHGAAWSLLVLKLSILHCIYERGKELDASENDLKSKHVRAGRSQELIKGISILNYMPGAQPCPLTTLWAPSPVLSCCICLQHTPAPSSKCLKPSKMSWLSYGNAGDKVLMQRLGCLVGFSVNPVQPLGISCRNQAELFSISAFSFDFKNLSSFVSAIRLHY